MTAVSVQVNRGTGSSVLWEQVRARLGLFVLTYLVLMVLGAGVVILVPSRYQARAVLEVVGPDGMPKPLSPVAAESFQKEITTSEVFAAAGKLLAESRHVTDYEAVRQLQDVVSVSVAPDKAWLVISADGDSPGRAAEDANVMAEAYRQVRAQHAELTRQRHEPQLEQRKTLEKTLADQTVTRDQAREAQAAFDAESAKLFGHAGDLAEARTDLERQMSRLQTDLADASTQVRSLTESLSRQEKELGDTPEFLTEETVTIGPNPERAALQAEIAQLERELAIMLKRFTEKHPEVIEKRSIIDQKKTDLEKLGRQVEDTMTRGKKPNPVYLQLKDKTEQTRGRLQQAEYAVKQKETSDPVLAERLKQLDERAGQLKVLVAARDRAQTEVDATQQVLERLDASLAVLQAGMVVPDLARRAQPPELPSGPDRGAWMIGVLALSLAGATTASFAAQLVDNSFASAYEVQRYLKLPVVGKVTRIETPASRARRNRMQTAMELGVGLLVAAGVLLVGFLLVYPSVIQGLRMALFGN